MLLRFFIKRRGKGTGKEKKKHPFRKSEQGVILKFKEHYGLALSIRAPFS